MKTEEQLIKEIHSRLAKELNSDLQESTLLWVLSNEIYDEIIKPNMEFRKFKLPTKCKKCNKEINKLMNYCCTDPNCSSGVGPIM